LLRDWLAELDPAGDIDVMTTMNTEVYDALRAVNVPEEKARAAAQALSTASMDLVKLEGKVTLLQWMVGFNLAMTVAMLWKIFGH
jgi:hypothetical protein